MQTTLVAEMLQPRMRPDEGQLSVELAVLRLILCVYRRVYEPEPPLVVHYGW